VIGNGDVTTPDAAKKMLDETGCAGVSIGRGAFYNPWIFRQTQHYLRTGELLLEPTFDERMGVMGRHFDLMIEVFGEELGCRMFRKIAAWYARRFGPAVDFRRRVVAIRSRADFSMAVAGYRAWRAQFCDEQGELRPKFQPPKLVASFLRTDPNQPAGIIPVPRGPIERW
jgi:tRNA-dihydrouridine synthase